MLGTAYAESLELVVALRLLLGVAEAAFFVASIAALADLAPPNRMGEATSYNSLGLYLGLAFGPPLAELLVRAGGFSVAWYGAATLSVVAALVAASIRDLRKGAPATAGRMRVIHWKAVPAALGFFASVVAMGALFAFGSLQADAVGLMPVSTPSVRLRDHRGGWQAAACSGSRSIPAAAARRCRTRDHRRRLDDHGTLDHTARDGARRGGVRARHHTEHAGLLLRDLRDCTAR